MKHYLVSIIVPTKNSAESLSACLESIKNQSYKKIEVIVVDNYSKDNTKKIARKYTNNVFNKGPERSAQRNYGVLQSKGEYLLFVDSDMELSKKVVESCVNKINKNTSAIIIPEESFGIGFWSKCKALEKSFYTGVEWMEAARFFTKIIYESVGGYNEDLISGEDWDLSQRVKNKTNISRIEYFIRHNEGELKLINIARKKYFYAKQIKKYILINDKEPNLKKQSGPLYRYGLFFSQPRKLFKNPV